MKAGEAACGRRGTPQRMQTTWGRTRQVPRRRMVERWKGGRPLGGGGEGEGT